MSRAYHEVVPSALHVLIVCWFDLSDCLLSAAFLVAGLSIWNNLLDTVTEAPTLSTFRQRLKTSLFSLSFLDIILD